MERPRRPALDQCPVPAADIEDAVVRSLTEYLRNQSGMLDSAITGHSAIAEWIGRIDVHEDRLAVRFANIVVSTLTISKSQ
jgi:hypothetical protein